MTKKKKATPNKTKSTPKKGEVEQNMQEEQSVPPKDPQPVSSESEDANEDDQQNQQQEEEEKEEGGKWHSPEVSTKKTPTTSKVTIQENDDADRDHTSRKPKPAGSTTKTKTIDPIELRGTSRLFAPYRSLGVVSKGPFYLLPNQNSSSAMACVAIGERFQILQCDKLHPVLVSQAVPGTSATGSGPQDIAHLLSDASLSISIVSHGNAKAKHPTNVTLFARTKPMSSIQVCPRAKNNEWRIVDLLHLGRIQVDMNGEKEGTKENAVLCAAVLSKGKEPAKETVPVVGDHDDDVWPWRSHETL